MIKFQIGHDTLSLLPFNCRLEVLVNTIRLVVANKNMGKEGKIPLFVDDILKCLENPKESLVKTIKEFHKVSYYKIKIQKSKVFIYTIKIRRNNGRADN